MAKRPTFTEPTLYNCVGIMLNDEQPLTMQVKLITRKLFLKQLGEAMARYPLESFVLIIEPCNGQPER